MQTQSSGLEVWVLKKWFTGLVDKRETDMKEFDFFLVSKRLDSVAIPSSR